MKHALNLSLVLAALLLSSACSESEGAAADGPARVEIEVGASGYDPAEVTATAGEPLTLVFTRITDQGCGQELVIPSQDIRRNLPLDEAVEVTFTPDAARTLRFTCGMDMYDGAIVVQ